VHKKEYGWSVGLVYDLRELAGVTTARPRVAGVLQLLPSMILLYSMFRRRKYNCERFSTVSIRFLIESRKNVCSRKIGCSNLLF
jgi:hypothetical protein